MATETTGTNTSAGLRPDLDRQKRAWWRARLRRPGRGQCRHYQIQVVQRVGLGVVGGLRHAGARASCGRAPHTIFATRTMRRATVGMALDTKETMWASHTWAARSLGTLDVHPHELLGRKPCTCSWPCARRCPKAFPAPLYCIGNNGHCRGSPWAGTLGRRLRAMGARLAGTRFATTVAAHRFRNPRDAKRGGKREHGYGSTVIASALRARRAMEPRWHSHVPHRDTT